VSGYQGSTGRYDDPVDALTLERLIDAKIAKLDKARERCEDISEDQDVWDGYPRWQQAISQQRTNERTTMKDSEFHDEDGNEIAVPMWAVNVFCAIGIIGLVVSIAGLMGDRLVGEDTHNFDREWATYQKGERAQQVGAPATANPYADAKHSNLWLDGWLHAANVVDRTGGQQ
jgi:hypothetical protein